MFQQIMSLFKKWILLSLHYHIYIYINVHNFKFYISYDIMEFVYNKNIYEP